MELVRPKDGKRMTREKQLCAGCGERPAFSRSILCRRCSRLARQAASEPMFARVQFIGFGPSSELPGPWARPTPPPVPGPRPALTPGQRAFIERLAWFFDRLDPTPHRLHVRGVWADPTDGAGSALGAPNLYRGFAVRIETSPMASRTEEIVEPCTHPGWDRSKGLCPTCSIFDEDGNPIGESGVRTIGRTLYRSPIRAAIESAGRAWVQPNRPPLDVALRALAAVHETWDIPAAALALARRWPAMADPKFARGHFTVALKEVARVYREGPPIRFDPPARRPDLQLGARGGTERDLTGLDGAV